MIYYIIQIAKSAVRPKYDVFSISGAHWIWAWEAFSKSSEGWSVMSPIVVGKKHLGREESVLNICKGNGLLNKADITYHATDCNVILTFSVVKFSSRSRKLSSWIRQSFYTFIACLIQFIKYHLNWWLLFVTTKFRSVSLIIWHYLVAHTWTATQSSISF